MIYEPNNINRYLWFSENIKFEIISDRQNTLNHFKSHADDKYSPHSRENFSQSVQINALM